MIESSLRGPAINQKFPSAGEYQCRCYTAACAKSPHNVINASLYHAHLRHVQIWFISNNKTLFISRWQNKSACAWPVFPFSATGSKLFSNLHFTIPFAPYVRSRWCGCRGEANITFSACWISIRSSKHSSEREEGLQEEMEECLLCSYARVLPRIWWWKKQRAKTFMPALLVSTNNIGLNGL